MFRTITLTAIAAILALAVTQPASANEQANGVKLNGLAGNGVTLNGIWYNGIFFNGIFFNGIFFNGIKAQGATDSRLVAIELPASQQ